ncbi:MAG: long-chain-fatty-acid--CoA ligase [Rhodobacteraceae bacterium]|nr:long-chain-fatty-acid--CoA ligase [Paracoccaceae bacterium]
MTFKTLRDAIFDNPRIEDDRLAIIADDRRITHAEFRNRVASVGRALHNAGVRPGDRVAVLMENVPEFLECYFAITGCGAIIVPLNWRLHPTEHALLLQDSQPRLLIASAKYEPTINVVRRDVASLKQIVVTDGVLTGCTSFAEWSDVPADMPKPDAIDHSSVATLLYTSGTTSKPKGVALSHGNYINDIEHVASVFLPGHESVNLQMSPMYHAAKVWSLMHLTYGGTTILERQFDPSRALEIIQAEKVTAFFSVPTMLYQMMELPNFGSFDISSLERISYGAAAITGARLQQAQRHFGNRLYHSYGLTESTSHCSMLTADDHERAVGSIGKGLKGVELRVVDAQGNETATDEIGEIVARGKNIMVGYWQMPEATAQTVIDGWLHTDDLGRRDEQGFVYVVDRKKDIVISGGVNIYPREVEDVIGHHPDVSEVAVLGVSHASWGESLLAAIVLMPSKQVSDAEILAYCRDHLGGYKVPKRIEFVDELPKTASGKTLKRELRERFERAD